MRSLTAPVARVCRVWTTVLGLEELPSFRGLRASLEHADTQRWREYFLADSLETAHMPVYWEQKLSAFQRMMILKAFKEEKVIFAVRDFVGAKLVRETPRPNLSIQISISPLPLLFTYHARRASGS